MIALKTHGKKIIDIDETSIDKILNVYSDESLGYRSVFVNARNTGELSIADLKAECDKILMPWQLFFLDPTRLDNVIKNIADKRASKFDNKLIASRDNEGHGISLRIADKVIGFQEFALSGITLQNSFCGSLKNSKRDEWAQKIIEHFEIESTILSSGKKEKTLGKLIELVEAKNIRVARGVLANKLLPAENTIRSTYRKSSGFAVRDDKLPYIFLPSEINDNETFGRQILTLVVLLVLIGLDDYSMYVTGNLELYIKSKKSLQQAFGVANEILLPFSETDKYKNTKITETIRDSLADRFMLTPSAVVVTLRQRGLIDSDNDQRALFDSIIPKKADPKHHPRSPKIDTSVRKLCGSATTNDVVWALRTDNLKSIPAQYLIFGCVDKLKFAKFKANVGL